MRFLLLFTLITITASPAFAMSTKEKVRMILWVQGIKETPKERANVITYPEEIEKPLRKF
ncbi:MAG: hypothetical protein V4598_12680 [Bdellovibrionota bacterium]